MMGEWSKMVLKVDKDFEKIVRFHEKIIKSLKSQKARGDQSFEEQSNEMQDILSIPSNKFLDWARSLDTFIKTVINSKLNDVELINEYQVFIKDLIDYQTESTEIYNKIAEYNADYDLFASLIIRLENKLNKFKQDHEVLKEKLNSANEDLDIKDDELDEKDEIIEDLKKEILLLRANQKERKKDVDLDLDFDKPLSEKEDVVLDDEVDEKNDYFENDDGGGGVVQKKEEEHVSKTELVDFSPKTHPVFEIQEKTQQPIQQQPIQQQEPKNFTEQKIEELENLNIKETPPKNLEPIIKTLKNIIADLDLENFKILALDNLDEDTAKQVKKIKYQFKAFETKPNHLAFIKKTNGKAFTVQDLMNALKIKKGDPYQVCYRPLKHAIATLDLFLFEKRYKKNQNKIGDPVYYSLSIHEPIDLPQGYFLSEKSINAIINMIKFIKMFYSIKKKRYSNT